MRKKETVNEMKNETKIENKETQDKNISGNVAPTESKLSEKDNSPVERPGTDNNCYTDFSSAGTEIVSDDRGGCQEKYENVFDRLSRINVNDKIELKNRMKYLSWAYAWGEAKKHYPQMTSKVYETESGMNYFTDGRTCWVKVGVTIEGLEYIEYYPVIDYRNASIPLAKVTSFDVNTSIQRGLTKAIARHGLGLYIYSGEDLPEGQGALEEKRQPLSNEILSILISEIENYEEQAEKLKQGIITNYKVRDLSELTELEARQAINRLKNFKRQSTKEKSEEN